MKLRSGDTIVAIATPPGTGAISIVRVSGPEAIPIVERSFRGTHRLSDTPTHTIRFGKIVDARGDIADEVLASVFRAPHSYTGEDSVEVSCHGGTFVTRMILEILVGAGARQAEPGEFSKRAFINGKLDLTQAEAVAEVIRANSLKSLQSSNGQLAGIVGESIREIKDDLVRLCSLLEIQLDFSDEGIDVAPGKLVHESLKVISSKIEQSITGYTKGRVIRDGISVVIVGRPNVGKSSLFNRLLLSDRSIVSIVPGTTRDFLEESITISDIAVRLFDTAGIRNAGDEVESEGIKRSRSLLQSADVLLLVVEASDDAVSVDRDKELIGNGVSTETKVIVVRNKIDLSPAANGEKSGEFGVSALSGAGFDKLKEAIVGSTSGSTADGARVGFITSRRHLDVLTRTKQLVSEAAISAASGLTPEFIASDLRSAIDCISEITGEVTTDDILNSIFSTFCIGK
jgi:tRNA modification GTPase